MRVAVESALVDAEVIEVSELPDLARAFGVRSVPRFQVDDEDALLGTQTERAIVDAVLGAARKS